MKDDTSDFTRSITGTWDYDTLPPNIRLGADCWIEAEHCFRRCRSQQDPAIVLGDRVRVYGWTTFNLETSGVLVVGDDSILVGPALLCAERIEIGRNVVVSYNVTIADADFHPSDPAERRRDAIANSPNGDRSGRPPYRTAPVRIEDDAWIGIGAIILKGVTIGAGARIGAGAVVTRDVAAGSTVVGNPAR